MTKGLVAAHELILVNCTPRRDVRRERGGKNLPLRIARGGPECRPAIEIAKALCLVTPSAEFRFAIGWLGFLRAVVVERFQAPHGPCIAQVPALAIGLGAAALRRGRCRPKCGDEQGEQRYRSHESPLHEAGTLARDAEAWEESPLSAAS